MNYGALIKNVLAGAINGFLAVTGGAAIVDINIPLGKAALIAAGIGALRAVQEWLVPTSYIREPESKAAVTLAGGKK